MTLRPALVPGLAAIAAVVVAVALAREAPDPSADVRRGSEDAFGRGLHPRELPPGGGPQRWTRDRSTFVFERLPAGAAHLEVELAAQRGPVAVVVDGAVMGVMNPGTPSGRFELAPIGGSRRRVELWATPFRAGDGRDLGALLGRVTLRPFARPSWPGWPLVLLLAGPALVVAIAALATGLAPSLSALVAVVVTVLQALALVPCGLLHSPYAVRLAVLVVLGALGGAACARAVRDRAAAPLAFVAFLVAFAVHVVLGTSPLMVVSDAVFHANKLVAVASGDFFPVSQTQHARPFRFPYGVSFYALLAPLVRTGADPVALVRGGAAVAGLVAQVALFVLVLRRTGPLAAFGATVVLALMPGTFDVAYSFGNLSNAFGQSVTIGFFAWWTSSAAGGWPVGAVLFALAALAHFSSLVFLVALVAALVVARRRELDRRHVLALVVGLAVAVAYYAHFWGLVVSQVPRLLEGGGQGRGASRTAWDAARLQVWTAAGQWGIPALVLAWIGRPRMRSSPFDRDLGVWWIAGLALALPAIVSPLEVRYVYGLAAAVAIAAGTGFARLVGGGPGKAWLGWALLAAQAVFDGAAILEALLRRYRT